MKNYIRKADIILFIVLVVTGLAASAVLSMSRSDSGPGARVIIESGGRIYATYSLYSDETVTVPAPDAERATDASSEKYSDYNIVIIRDGKVSVSEASCKNQVCVKHGPISGAGETIVCLPNRLVVRIEDPEGGGYDAVTS